MTRLDGDFAAEGGAVVVTALNAVMEPWAVDPTDHRSSAQRRADALEEICRHYLDCALAPRSGGERPHITLTVDLATLEERAGTTCELDDTGSSRPRPLAVSPVMPPSAVSSPGEHQNHSMSGAGLGPSHRPSEEPLVVRDGGCTADGCDRPPRWADAHHEVHWVDGGPTALDNLVLLCRRHHRMVHGP